MILRNLLCARRTMHHIRYTIEIWPLFTGDWSHINAYGLPGMPQPELEKILKKKKQAGSRKVVKTIGKSNKMGSHCLILQYFLSHQDCQEDLKLQHQIQLLLKNCLSEIIHKTE